MGDHAVARAPGTLVTHALGSCVGVVLYDAACRTGGLLHAQLPDSRLDARLSASRPSTFVDLGLRTLLSELARLGTQPSGLNAALVGGAAIPGAPSLYDIGAKNSFAAQMALRSLGIPVVDEELGGAVARTVRLELDSGRVIVTTAGLPARILQSAA